MPPALQLIDVTRRYRTTVAVDRLGFQVAPQEIFALLGPNGAGKTTTVRMIQGILAPDEGRIEFGIDGARGPCRPGLGYLPEDRGLYRDQPIHVILEVFGRLRGLGKADARARTDAWLERFGLADRRTERLDALSKGNQQKVQFAAAILHRPRLAVLDEPFSGLDPLNQDLFLDLLEELRREGMTILLSAHQMELVERCADRVLIMGAGRCLLESDLAGLRARQGERHVLRVERRDDAGPPPVGDPELVAEYVARPDGSLRITSAEGVSLEDLLGHVAGWSGLVGVETGRPRLHDVYVQVVQQAGLTGPHDQPAGEDGP